ncbi:phosphotransferase [Patescibacteria group bacterium]|nr:phosphotransferase [Patescibacteria group bacterium]
MNIFRSQLVTYLRTLLPAMGEANVSFPPQGMSSHVFFLTSGDTAYAVKYGPDATKDVPTLTLIHECGTRVPVPEVVTEFVFESVPVLVMTCIQFPLLDTVAVTELPLYIPSMVSVMRKLHTITNPVPRVLSAAKDLPSWQEYLLAQFDGRTIDWTEVLDRPTLDRALVAEALARHHATLSTFELKLPEYALLHTDFNQRNLFVNSTTRSISGVIDWEDAVFGDPIYDFSRIRMLLWHFDLPDSVVRTYDELMRYTDAEHRRERLYWTGRVIQYLAWYSEEDTPFNTARIALHQKYLHTLLNNP